MNPLKITFTFGSPVVVDSEYPLHLDALLAWSRVQEATEQGVDDPLRVGHEDLPLGRAGNDDSFVWQASRLIFSPKAPRQMVNMQRKSSPEQFYADFDNGLWSNGKKNPPVINTQSGQFRAYQYYVATQWMEKAECWCIGDLDRVKALLDRLESIGKMGRNGWGLISDIVIEEVKDDGRWKIRVLPENITGFEGIEYVPVMSPSRPPYWDKLKRVAMFEPVV